MTFARHLEGTLAEGFTLDQLHAQGVEAVDLPDRRRKRAISPGPGISPRCSRGDGEIAFYAPGRGLMSVHVDLGEELEAAAPELLFDLKVAQFQAYYDVSDDGELFVIAQNVELTSEDPLVGTGGNDLP